MLSSKGRELRSKPLWRYTKPSHPITRYATLRRSRGEDLRRGLRWQMVAALPTAARMRSEQCAVRHSPARAVKPTVTVTNSHASRRQLSTQLTQNLDFQGMQTTGIWNSASESTNERTSYQFSMVWYIKKYFRAIYIQGFGTQTRQVFVLLLLIEGKL